jgi:Holliday junction DNA helicase RuvA
VIVRLTGTVVEVTEESATVERDGIAREVLVPGYAIGELTACRGREVTLHTLEFIEANQASGNLTPRLVGFVHPEDRIFFKRFISVKGIGTRKALKALAEPVRMVASWIEQADHKLLATLPGIGKRAAEMIVAELRGKLGDFAMGGAVAQDVVDSGRFTDAQRVALEVLLALGETKQDAERWLQRAAQVHPVLNDTEELVKVAYRIKTGVEG